MVESQPEFESQPKTVDETETVASSGGETQGRTVAKATVIDEDVTESSGSKGAEDKDVSSPEAVEGKHHVSSWWRLKKHQRAIGALLIAICVSFVVYGLKWLATSRQGNHQKMTSVQVYRASIKKGTGDILNFASFVVMLSEEDNRAYLLLSISGKVSNSNVYKEINEKMTSCRGAIHSVLIKAVKTSNKQIISKERLKQDIMDALNGIVATGTVDSIYFTEFLMV